MTTEQAQHTPGPWQVRSTSDLPQPEKVFAPVPKAVPGSVALVADCSQSYVRLPEERRANAAFIVLACNAFDDLLAAAEAVTDGWGQYHAIHVAQNYKRMTFEQIEAGSKRFTDGLESLRTAISKAKGDPK